MCVLIPSFLEFVARLNGIFITSKKKIDRWAFVFYIDFYLWILIENILITAPDWTTSVVYESVFILT